MFPPLHTRARKTRHAPYRESRVSVARVTGDVGGLLLPVHVGEDRHRLVDPRIAREAVTPLDRAVVGAATRTRRRRGRGRILERLHLQLWRRGLEVRRRGVERSLLLRAALLPLVA